MTRAKAKPAKRPARAKMPAANLAIMLGNEGIELQNAQRQARVDKGTESAIEYGMLRSERLVGQAVRSGMSELGMKSAAAALAVPTQLFALHLTALPLLSDARIDEQTYIENNLPAIYALQPGEYGHFGHQVAGEEVRVMYATAQKQAVASYARVVAGSGARPVSIEPRMFSELRAVAAEYPTTLVVYGEMGATYLVNLHERDILSLQEVRELEQTMVRIGRGEGFTSGARTLYSGQDHNLMDEALGRLLEMIDAERNYADMIGLDLSNQPVLLAGDLDQPGGAEVFTALTGVPFESASQHGISLATQGLLLRGRPDLNQGALGLNLLERDMLPVQENAAGKLAGYVAPLVILGAVGGFHLMQASALSAQQQRQASINAQLAELQPQVSEQLELQERNTVIQQELMRAEQVRSGQSYWPQYLEMITRRVPDANLVGITSLSGKRDREAQAREFDGRTVDLVFEVEVQAKTREAMNEFIQAFNTAPFALSVSDYAAGSGSAAEGRFIKARIGMNSAEVNPVIRRELEDRAKARALKASEDSAQPVPPNPAGPVSAAPIPPSP